MAEDKHEQRLSLERRGGTDAEPKKRKKEKRQETLGYEDKEIKMQ